MSINASPSIVLSGAAADSPRIYWDNVVTAATLYADEEAAAEPASNAGNPASYLKWRGTSTAAQVIGVALAAPAAVDYMAIAGHNFGSARITVTFQTSVDGNDWADLAAGTSPADDSVIIVEFPSDFSKYWRLSLSAGILPPAVGVLYAGQKLVLQRGIYVGHTPITLGRSTIVSSGRSESGQFLGRVLRRATIMSQVDMHHIKPAWYRANMQPFVIAASTTPFFWRWKPRSYPAEAGYSWLTGDVSVSNEMSNGMMQFSFSMQAIP